MKRAGAGDRQPLLEVRDLRHSYGGSAILRGLNLTLYPGERLAVRGPSGSGKSTLLNCLGGIDRPNGGEILFEREPFHALTSSELARFRREKISTIFQFFHLLPTLSVRENVEFPLALLGVEPKARRGRAEDLIREVGLDHRQDAFPDELSGGEMQRVGIARAVIHRPRLLLADEPTGNLDSKTGETILALLQRILDEYQAALVLVTHSDQAAQICSRQLGLEDGILKTPA